MRSDTSRGDDTTEAAGVRTFLIADVRGYTRYSEMHGDEAASALARRFAELAGEAVRERGGEVVELRGDEALCVFASARAAVRGAVELQRRVREPSDGAAGLPLGVGIGLDAGEAVPTAGGYRGRALNVAARLCSLAKGGEILASEAVAHLAGQDDEAGYAPRRPTTVKGLPEPLRFVEVIPKVELPPPPPPPSPEQRRRRRTGILLIGVGLAVAAGAAVAAVQLSTGGDANPSSVQTIASDQCSSLYYEGEGSPDLLIAADLPLQPGILATTNPMVNALTLMLERREYRAGRYSVGLQVCDDATPTSVIFDEGLCLENAGEYARNRSVVGVVGPLASGCAMLEIPVLNQASGGPVAIVSPSNTYVGLTRGTPGAAVDEPAVYYPTRKRNYARVIPADDVQAAASAIVARRLGVKRVYALDDGEEFSVALVTDFIRAARRLGIAVAGRGDLDLVGESYDEVAATIARTRADGVFLGIGSGPQGVGLLRDFRARLGPTVQFMASDGFDPETAVLAGAAAEGMTISVPGPLSDDLGPGGDDFVAAFSKRFGAEPARGAFGFAVNAAQAIEVLLAAIARSEGTRASVTRNLFATSISNGILGSFRITPTGDTTLNVVSIYRIVGGDVETFETVAVPDTLIAQE